MSQPEDITEQLARRGVVPVVVIDRASDAVPLARALCAGGLDVIEITLRTEAGLDALRAIRREVPEMLAGIGTLRTPEQVAAVCEAGAVFGVAPATSPAVLDAARHHGLPFAPGVVTPSDIERAIEAGCRLLKFFPAEACGGLPYLKAIAAPYQHLGVRFMPTGGITAATLSSYLEFSPIAAVGGTWIAPKDLINRADWAGITALAKEASSIVAKRKTA